MSFNKYMHPRNPFFNKPPDFEKLKNLYPEFSKFFFKDKTKIDLSYNFKDPEALRCLYCILMKEYFGKLIHIFYNLN